MMIKVRKSQCGGRGGGGVGVALNLQQPTVELANVHKQPTEFGKKFYFTKGKTNIIFQGKYAKSFSCCHKNQLFFEKKIR
jgi:hypothetical protein